MSASREEIEQFFAAHGLRSTPQRYAVMEFLLAKPQHATADEIFEAVNRLDPRASRATIYNNLTALVEAGLVRELRLDARATRFEANTGKHHHFVCERCGKVEDIHWFEVPHLARRSGLGRRTIRSYEMVMRGLCRACS